MFPPFTPALCATNLLRRLDVKPPFMRLGIGCHARHVCFEFAVDMFTCKEWAVGRADISSDRESCKSGSFPASLPIPGSEHARIWQFAQTRYQLLAQIATYLLTLSLQGRHHIKH